MLPFCGPPSEVCKHFTRRLHLLYSCWHMMTADVLPPRAKLWPNVCHPNLVAQIYSIYIVPSIDSTIYWVHLLQLWNQLQLWDWQWQRCRTASFETKLSKRSTIILIHTEVLFWACDEVMPASLPWGQAAKHCSRMGLLASLAQTLVEMGNLHWEQVHLPIASPRGQALMFYLNLPPRKPN